MKPRRVLQVVATLDRGGAQRSLVQMLSCIDRKRYHIDFLVFDDQGVYAPQIRTLGCRVLRCAGHRNPVRLAYNFSEALSSYGPFDVVHSHYRYSGNLMRVAAGHRIPLRITHARSDWRHADRIAGLHRRLYGRLDRHWVGRFANAKLAVSAPAAAALFGDAWAADPLVRIIRSGIDFTRFAPMADEGRVRSDLGLPPEAVIIGHVGRLAAEKNHNFLLKIGAAAIARDPRVRLLIIGDGPLLKTVTAEARSSAALADRVVFMGDRDDVPTLMQSAMDVLLLPSLREGLPRVVLEAQAAGLPSIVSDRVTEEADVVKALVHRLPLAATPDAWASSALEIARQRPLSHARACRIMLESEFSIDAAVEATAAIYDGRRMLGI